MAFDILSVFPEMFQSTLGSSLIKKSIDKGLVEVNLHNIRDYTRDKHRTTDDTPYGGGGGMVMKVEPVSHALEAITPAGEKEKCVILLSPQGEPFSQKIAEELSHHPRIVLICGHYEGIDERVREHLVDREISIGDYILSGGELPAMVVVDAVSRLVPGFVGNSDSVLFDSFSTGLLEGPHYTNPREYKGWKVPDVLLSGHQKKIDEWRRRESLRRTLHRRPDMLRQADLTEDDTRVLGELKAEDPGCV
ncbi:MAG: tRNA (guanosine(37)-N1)-methyltransferase TrmD [Deltaproteobacteria bacterium]|nr:tRNA (guanosine(37)-N1)-methyltransferase TrmD [Deltaproteobacteria bacterium]MBW2673987.1 tRNA (guanosine(37)-N1)-methyltransferase TrmD [Deltaproteobacteria bacterium]